MEPELPLEPELPPAPELPVDPEPAAPELELPLDPAFPELLLEPVLPAEPDELLLIPPSVGIERPLSGAEVHAENVETIAKRTGVE